MPEPWRSNVTASVAPIDDLECQISEINRRLKGHADHPYIALLMSAPGIRWVALFVCVLVSTFHARARDQRRALRVAPRYRF